MEKLDLKKQHKALYNPAKKPGLIDIPEFNFLMINGEGDPNKSPAFQAAVEALYALSYTIKFMIKKGDLAIDYGVMPLEGLWWVDDMTTFSIDHKENWMWTLMIMQPEIVTTDIIDQARKQAIAKRVYRNSNRFGSNHLPKATPLRSCISAHSRKKGRLSKHCIRSSNQKTSKNETNTTRYI